MEGPGKNKEGNNKQRGDSEGRRIQDMEKSYKGPEDRRGISSGGVEGEEDLRRAKEYAEMIVDTVREGLLVLDFDLRVEAANESFYRMFEVAPDETEGRLVYELGDGQWDIPRLRELLEEVLPEETAIMDYEITHTFENAGRRTMRLNAHQLNEHQLILLAIEDVTEQRRARQTLEEQAKQLRRLAAELASAEQRERRRLAALLHDELQQLLYGAEMQLGMARGKAEADSALADAIEAASRRIEAAVEAARDLTGQLRPPALYEAGLTPALKWLASNMAERHDLDVILDTEGVETGAANYSLSDDVKAMLFDCARELLFNAVKHAGVSEARLALHIATGDADQRRADPRDAATGASPDRLHLVVEDEGCGFDVEAALEARFEEGRGLGLFSIRERLAALGGATTIESSEGEGTRVELALLLRGDASDEPASLPASRDGHEAPGLDVASRQAVVRVVIADDHPVVRQGIANLLIGDRRTDMVDGHGGRGGRRPGSSRSRRADPARRRAHGREHAEDERHQGDPEDPPPLARDGRHRDLGPGGPGYRAVHVGRGCRRVRAQVRQCRSNHRGDPARDRAQLRIRRIDHVRKL